MQRRLFLVLATAFAAAGCTTPNDTDETVDGDGDMYVDLVDIDVEGLTTEPAAGMAQPTLAWVRENYGDTVLFAFDSSTVSVDGQTVIREWAGWMRQFPSVTITLQGHCDERGTREYNLALGERRADAVRNLLVALGTQPGHIATISYGKERPAVEGHDEGAWARNRRVVLTLA